MSYDEVQTPPIAEIAKRFPGVEYVDLFADRRYLSVVGQCQRPSGFELDRRASRSDVVIVAELFQVFSKFRDFEKTLGWWNDRGVTLLALDVMPRLRPGQERHPNPLRRRAVRCALSLCRRATGRSGG